jgi:hypothetical protein
VLSSAESPAKVTVKWEPPFNSKSPDEFKKKQRNKEVDLTTTFFPGSYGGFDVILSPAKPEEIKTIYVALLFNQLSLSR